MLRGDWTWAQGPRHGATTARALQYIDFAAAHGFSGVLVEGWNKGWDGEWFGHGDAFDYTQAVPDFDLKAVTDHARAQHVALIGHNETGGNIANYESQLDAAITEALERDVPHPNAVRLALERRRDDRQQAPPVALTLPAHVQARDKAVRAHSLEIYDQLKAVGHEEP